jgi:CRP-like cAMP-binding protein
VQDKQPETPEAASEGVRKAPQIDHLGYARLLGQVDLFMGLERVTLAKLAAHLEPLFYPSHSIIFRQGEPGDAFYLVASGSVGVYVAAHSRAAETPLKILHVGEPFGEMALLTNSTRAATIKAETDCEVLRLDRSSFLDLVREHPGVALSIAATLSRRLAGTSDQQDEMHVAAAAQVPPQAGGGTATLARPRWWPGRRGIALAAALIILSLGVTLPPPAGLSAGAWHALVVLSAALPAVMVLAVLPAPARDDVNWITWTLYAAPLNLVLFGGLLASLLWLYRPAAGEQPSSEKRAGLLALQRALLGPMSREEKIALGVGIGLIVGFMTEPFHGVDPPWIAVLGTGVLTATGVVTVNTLRTVNWNFALLYGLLISLATVFGHTGLDHWIADRVSAAAGDFLGVPVIFVIGLAVLCFAISFIIRWQAAAPLVTIALAPVASVSGVHPVIVGLVAVIACNTFFLPYQSTSYLALWAGTAGKLFTHRQVVPMALAYAAWTIVAILLSVPLWRLMGLT